MHRPAARSSTARRRSSCAGALALLAALAALAGCGDGAERATAQRGPVVGFVYVGSVHDAGYNQAIHEATGAIRRAFPRARVLHDQRVPEGPAAARAMQAQIDRGATILFATSFGHLEPALEVAARNPQVTVLHQGGLSTATNLGTYFGTIWEGQYAAGQAAALESRTHRLGYVAAFPIAQALLGINAFERGARSVDPRARTRVAFTSAWCAPARQRRAARRLLAWGADVLAQHQDCTRTVLETAEAAGARSIGFHHDASRLAPKGWITGVRTAWGPLFADIVRTVLEGRFADSPYAGRHRAGMADGVVRLAPFGRGASPATRRIVLRTADRLRRGTLQPFAGTVRDQAGRIRLRGRQQPGVTQLEETDYLVEGVEGHARR
ncbi:MAG TPA: BMP family ABC transporter substrate-binding protein [Baekduia sp.]|nr:BMP family ABC transporter substrate-binding protein [Baekduia sp.]